MVYGNYDGKRLIDIKFGLSHIKRIYPFYLIGIIMTIPYYLIGTDINTIVLKRIIKIVFVDTCLLKAWIPNPQFYFSSCGVMWFVSTIFFCYCSYPLIKKMDEISNKMILELGAVIYVCQICIKTMTYKCDISLAISDWICYIFPLTKIMDFMIGVVIGIFYKRGCFRSTLNKLFVVIGIVLYAMTNYIKNNNIFAVQDYFGNYFCTIPIVILLVGATRFSITNERLKTLVYNLADKTMVFFVFHQTIICYIKRFVKIESKQGETVLIFVTCFVFTELMYWSVINFKRKKDNAN